MDFLISAAFCSLIFLHGLWRDERPVQPNANHPGGGASSAHATADEPSRKAHRSNPRRRIHPYYPEQAIEFSALFLPPRPSEVRETTKPRGHQRRMPVPTQNDFLLVFIERSSGRALASLAPRFRSARRLARPARRRRGHAAHLPRSPQVGDTSRDRRCEPRRKRRCP